MTKEKKIKHLDWQMSRSEKNWYYVGDTARLFCSSLVVGYMTMFLMFQGINTASLATAMLIVKIIDLVLSLTRSTSKIGKYSANWPATANICPGTACSSGPSPQPPFYSL